MSKEAVKPLFEILYRHLLTGTKKTVKNFSQAGRSPGRDLNPGLPENET
jgi:hypothetical protein